VDRLPGGLPGPRRFLATTRGRLTLVWVAVFAAALVVANLSLYLAIAFRENTGLDEQLRMQAAQVEREMKSVDGRPVYLGGDLPHETGEGLLVDVAVVGPQGIVMSSAGEPLGAATLQSLASPVIRSDRPSLVDFHDRQDVHRRACVVPLASIPEQRLVLVATTPLTEVDASLAQAAALLVLLSLAALAGSGILVYWLIGRVLRPVSTIAALAESLSEHDLHRRVEVETPDDEVGDLARTFNRMLARLEAAFLALRSFTADASHELRSPLALMATELEYALAPRRRAGERERSLRLLQDEVQHMADMVEKLLLLARADAGELRPARTRLDVADFVHEATVRWLPVARRKPVALEVEVPDSGTMVADPDLTRRILDNLIANGIRHSPAAGRLLVGAHASAGGWTIEVGDQGAGIPPHERERAFERFARADSARSRDGEGGTGLGLPLSRAFARAQGGELRLVERPGWGAVFRLWLPGRAYAARSAGSAPAARGPGSARPAPATPPRSNPAS
jgi:signal transduction histidine kinase